MWKHHVTATPSPSRRAHIALGLALALVLPLCHLGSIGRRFSGLGPLWGGEILWWVLVAVIIVYVTHVEDRPLSSIGFRVPGAGDIGIAIVAALVMIALIGVIFTAVGGLILTLLYAWRRNLWANVIAH
jgi:hypothetical protein